jgi:predicted RNase H-like HicB family nuclease
MLADNSGVEYNPQLSYKFCTQQIAEYVERVRKRKLIWLGKREFDSRHTGEGPKKRGFEMINIEFDSIVFQEGNTYVAYSPKLDVSSCGGTVDDARNNLKTAVRLFLEEAQKMGTLEDILSESGYEKAGFGDWLTPRLIATELMSVHG